ncbi:hypothetical protein [Rickettsia helvetica]|uniref:Transposase n=1 Tax=Rickettsia helvetica TaxID=35789 RepID=A0ABP0T697_RICHE|nr:hypothetical protein [Rickettsia helvetica]MCZ6884026.1 hypothetical protein [Rickettsia endosymbiont of Ixodes ricinus]MCZ6897072.1 hypothetical protein [Rickettsia endosymbiont of Ixodes ricinus]
MGKKSKSKQNQNNNFSIEVNERFRKETVDYLIKKHKDAIITPAL